MFSVKIVTRRPNGGELVSMVSAETITYSKHIICPGDEPVIKLLGFSRNTIGTKYRLIPEVCDVDKSRTLEYVVFILKGKGEEAVIVQPESTCYIMLNGATTDMVYCESWPAPPPVGKS